MSTSPVILIIDDEDDIRMLIAGILEDEGYLVKHAATSDQALQMIGKHSPDLIIQDIWLQGSEKDGIEILQSVKITHSDLPFLMISGHGTIETAVSAIKAGAYDFIEKPFKSDRLLLMISRALENAALKKQNAELRKKTSGIAFDDARSLPEPTQHLLEKAAKSNSRIMITGEVGTGKLIAAHFVHEKSNRSAMPFITLDCAALHPEQLEKELFGNASGAQQAYTPGLLRRINGGTLVLNEVSAMPLETQGKLLSFLQDSMYYDTKSHKNIPIDLRIIATSSDNIDDKIRSGGFRKDLFYRLNVVPIMLTPLRKRKNEIGTLIELFSNLKFSEQALIKLKSYKWPGNIKQLQNVLEWVSLMHEDKDVIVEASILPMEINGNSAKEAKNIAENDNIIPPCNLLEMSLREARESFERHYLLSQVNRFDGNISRTAEFIGMERSALHRKLKSLEVFSDDKQNIA